MKIENSTLAIFDIQKNNFEDCSGQKIQQKQLQLYSA